MLFCTNNNQMECSLRHCCVVMCRHRMGMVCAAGRDHRAATKLLQESRQHYAQQEEGHPLQHEAEAGLAMAK